eukprot:scaffold28_cov515-Prasinococcus_capsulatus_cf.AAC.29
MDGRRPAHAPPVPGPTALPLARARARTPRHASGSSEPRGLLRLQYVLPMCVVVDARPRLPALGLCCLPCSRRCCPRRRWPTGTIPRPRAARCECPSHNDRCVLGCRLALCAAATAPKIITRRLMPVAAALPRACRVAPTARAAARAIAGRPRSGPPRGPRVRLVQVRSSQAYQDSTDQVYDPCVILVRGDTPLRHFAAALALQMGAAREGPPMTAATGLRGATPLQLQGGRELRAADDPGYAHRDHAGRGAGAPTTTRTREDEVEDLEDGEVDQLLGPAAAALAERRLFLQNTAYCLTARGCLRWVPLGRYAADHARPLYNEEDIFTLETGEVDSEDDGEGIEVRCGLAPTKTLLRAALGGARACGRGASADR